MRSVLSPSRREFLAGITVGEILNLSASSQAFSGTDTIVSNVAALASIPPGEVMATILAEPGREGLFIWNDSNLSREVALDSVQGIYIAPASDPKGASGAWVRQFEGPVQAHVFGTDGAGLQAMFNLLCDPASAGAHKKIAFRGTYTLDRTVSIPDPSNLTVDAQGAKFTTAADILLFDLNNRADPTFTDNESRQNFHWAGGSFYCTSTERKRASAFRAFGMRYASIEPQLMEGWRHCVQIGAKDTITIANFKSFDNLIPIIAPPWSSLGGLLLTSIKNVHFSHAHSSSPAVRIYGHFADSSIKDNSYNLGTDADHEAVVDLLCAMIMPCASISGTFTTGDTVTGSSSGATATVVELYEHMFPFAIPQPMRYLVLGSKSAADFLPGEVIRGRRGTAVLSETIPAKAQRPRMQSVEIGSPKEHWEAGSTANGAVGVRVRDFVRRGAPIQNIKLDVGSLGINSRKGKRPSIGVLFEGVRDSTVTGRFAQTDQASSAPLRLDPQCADIKILGSAIFSSGRVDLNGMARSDLDLSDFNTHPEVARIVGLESLEIPPGGMPPRKIEMSEAFEGYAAVGGLPPMAYLLNIGLKGTEVSSAADVSLRLHSTDDSAPFILQIASMADDQLYMRQVLVRADGNGNLTLEAHNQGGGRVTASIAVAKVIY